MWLIPLLPESEYVVEVWHVKSGSSFGIKKLIKECVQAACVAKYKLPVVQQGKADIAGIPGHEHHLEVCVLPFVAIVHKIVYS